MKKINDSYYQAEGSHIIGDVVIGRDSSVWYNAVLRGQPSRITIGEGSNVQENVVIHVNEAYPVRIGDGVTIGHAAVIHGCEIGDNSLIGIGSIILNGAAIGKNCIIGAGSLVTQNTVIPDGSMAFGSPAKIIRSLTEEEIRENAKNTAEYIAFAKELAGT